MKTFTAIFMILLTMMQGISIAKEMSIAEALEIALSHSPSILSTRQEIQKAQGVKIQADGLFTPSLSVTGSLSEEKESLVTDGNRSDSRSAALTLAQELYTGGRNTALRSQARSGLLKASSQVTDAEEALAAQVYSCFYNVLLARETVLAAQEAVATSQQHVREVQHMVDLGLANHLEMIRAEQQLSSNQADLSEALGSLNTAEITLLNLIGLPPSSSLSASGKLSAPAAQGTIEQSLELAKCHRADLQALEHQIAIQRSQVRVAQSGMAPSLTFSASLLSEDPYNRQDTSHDDWQARLDLEFPIYDRAQTRGEVIQAKAQLEQDLMSLEQKKLDILSEVKVAWVEIRSSRDRASARSQELTLAKETLRLSEVGYREGVTPQLDLLDAQAELTLARKNYSQALYDCLMNLVALKRAEGILIPWTQEGGTL